MMSRTRLLTVIGTRPQFVKYGALAGDLRDSFEEILVDTGQHYDDALSSAFLEEFDVPRPGYVLDAGEQAASLQVSEMLRDLHDVVEREGPDRLLCVGDTNSTLAAALTGTLEDLPVAHLEAGERSFDGKGNRVDPWSIPEEANRVMVDRVSSLLLCASARAVRSLEEEGVRGRVVQTGDIMYDLYRRQVDRILAESDVLKRLGVESRQYHYATVHRAINTDDPHRLAEIFSALAGLDRDVVLPLHPRTEKRLHEFGLWGAARDAENLRLLEPVSYTDSIALNHHADTVVTDSGGVLREAYFGGVPSVMVDDTTEWIDVVDSGWAVMTGADAGAIAEAVGRNPPAAKPALFGDGDAVARVISALREWAE